MKQEDIIRMAQEAGGCVAELPNGDAWLFDDNKQLKRFADLVAAHEREACAKVCEDLPVLKISTQYDWTRQLWQDCAAAIRARGEK